MNRYVGRMVAAIATNPKIMPSKKPREDRHTPPHPLSITFNDRVYYKALYSAPLRDLSAS